MFPGIELSGEHKGFKIYWTGWKTGLDSIQVYGQMIARFHVAQRLAPVEYPDLCVPVPGTSNPQVLPAGNVINLSPMGDPMLDIFSSPEELQAVKDRALRVMLSFIDEFLAQKEKAAEVKENAEAVLVNFVDVHNLVMEHGEVFKLGLSVEPGIGIGFSGFKPSS